MGIKNALAGVVAAIITMIILKSLSMYLFTFEIPDMFIGWISCVSYFNVAFFEELYETD